MKIFIVSTFLITFSFSQSDAVQLQDVSEEMLAPDHISMLIHEDLINEFFKNMGKVSGGGKNYEWILKNPRIEITNKKAVFKAEIQVLVGFISSTQDVIGKVDVRYGLTVTSKKGQGGKIYNPKQMAQLGKVQKNFIDKYNSFGCVYAFAFYWRN